MDTVLERDVTDLEKQQEEFASRFNMSFKQYKQVVKSCTMDEVITVFELQRCRNHHSMFRRKMASKLHRWFELGIACKPFSEKEFKLLMPTWRIDWKLPT